MSDQASGNAQADSPWYSQAADWMADNVAKPAGDMMSDLFPGDGGGLFGFGGGESSTGGGDDPQGCWDYMAD